MFVHSVLCATNQLRIARLHGQSDATFNTLSTHVYQQNEEEKIFKNRNVMKVQWKHRSPSDESQNGANHSYLMTLCISLDYSLKS